MMLLRFKAAWALLISDLYLCEYLIVTSSKPEPVQRRGVFPIYDKSGEMLGSFAYLTNKKRSWTVGVRTYEQANK